MPVKFKFSTKPEKTIAAATAAIVLSIIFDEHKKKLRGSKKYNNFPKRVIKNYKKMDDLMKNTVAKELYDEAAQFNDEQLKKLTIENGEFIKL